MSSYLRPGRRCGPRTERDNDQAGVGADVEHGALGVGACNARSRADAVRRDDAVSAGCLNFDDRARLTDVEPLGEWDKFDARTQNPECTELDLQVRRPYLPAGCVDCGAIGTDGNIERGD